MRKLLSKKNATVAGCELLLYNPATRTVLFTKREDVPIWVLPGGGIEDQETPTQGIIREVREEIGISIKKPILFARYTSGKNWVKFAYFSLYKNSKIKIDSEEITEYGWFKPFNLPSFILDYQREKLADLLNYLVLKKVVTRNHKVNIYKETLRLLASPRYFIQIIWFYVINRFTKKTFKITF